MQSTENGPVLAELGIGEEDGDENGEEHVKKMEKKTDLEKNGIGMENLPFKETLLRVMKK